MDKSRKKSAVLFVCILLVLGMWMMLSVYSQAAGTNNDEKQAQTIRVGSFEAVSYTHLTLPTICSV